MGREFELKYAATEEAQQAILERYGNFTLYRMRTRYYDTPDRALSGEKITLRCRMENDRSICTLKTPGTGSGRGEWELEAPDIRDAAPHLAVMAGREDLLSRMNQLECVCGAEFLRRAKVLEKPGCTVELAVDKGFLLGGGREAPLCEVEVELKGGSEDACLDFARSFAREFGLVPEEKSKFKRALALADGQ